jgi:enhanced filamentous growth protein 1
MRNGQSAAGLPSLPQHHSQPSMGASLPSSQAPVQSQGNMGRPSLDRAHTFPTPPTSASSLIGPMGASDSYQWSQQGAQGHMPVDAGLNNARSMPTTPTTSPPGSGMQSMQQYPPSSQQYDSSRQMYAAPPAQQTAYPSNGQDRHLYGQPNYGKSEMGPPSSRPSGPGSAGDQVDSKTTNGILHPGQPGDGVGHHEDEAEHDHESEYTHDNGAYDANRAPYNYNAPPVASLPTEHQHMSPEMAGSPHQAGSGRATPRTAAAPQPYYPQQGYGTPPRGQQAPGSLYNVMSNDRGPANGAPPNDVYAPQADMGASMTNGYPAQQSLMNGTSGAIKRGRDDEDERPGSGGPGSIDLKRRKTMLEGSYTSPQYETLNRPTSAVSSRGARR